MRKNINNAEAAWWEVIAQFEDRVDAIAFMDLCADLGVKLTIKQRYRSKPTPIAEQRLPKLLLAKMIPNKTYGSEELSVLCEELSYKPGSYGPTMSKLAQEGFVERVGDGLYRIRLKE